MYNGNQKVNLMNYDTQSHKNKKEVTSYLDQIIILVTTITKRKRNLTCVIKLNQTTQEISHQATFII